MPETAETQEATQDTTDDATPGDTGRTTAEPKVEFSGEQQAHVAKLLSEERRKAKQAGRDEATAAADAERQRLHDESEADAAKKRGDFEKVETKLRADLTSATETATTLRAENDAYKTAMEEAIAGQWDDMPEIVRDLYRGDEDDVLGRFAYMTDPKTVKHIKQLAKDATKKETGMTGTPRPNGSTTGVDDEAARRASALRYG
jgi:hypothetical protein